MPTTSDMQHQAASMEPSRPENVENGGFPSRRHLKWIVSTLMIYFALRLIFFATNVAPFLPPDEITHFCVSRVFAKVLLLPSNSPESYEHGLVTNIPWLYYWIMGKLLPLNLFGIPDLMFLRLLNIPFAFGTVYFTWRTLRLLTEDRTSQFLLLAAVTNTLKFSFLSASVSYDNLLNLLAAMAIYYLLAFFRERSGTHLALSLLCQLAGSLTKITFLPLIVVLTILLLCHEFRTISSFPRALREWVVHAGWQGKVLPLAVLLALALNLHLYGGNLLQHHALDPEMDQVISAEAALQNRIQARNLIFRLFKEGRISKERALEMAQQIKTRDRVDAIGLIENYDAVLKGAGEKRLSPLEYCGWWLLNVVSTVYGIKAHLYMPNKGPMTYLCVGLLLLSALAFVARWRPHKKDAALTASLAITAAYYAFFILYFVNYATYLDTWVFGVTLTGRYLLPVIGTLYVLSSYYLPSLFRNGYARGGFAVAVALLFIASDFPFFMLHATPEWFVDR